MRRQREIIRPEKLKVESHKEDQILSDDQLGDLGGDKVPSSTVISPLVIKLEDSSDKISDDIERGGGEI